MDNSDKGNFARLLMTLAELHTKKLSQQLLDIYWHALKTYEYQDVMLSLNRLIIDPDIGQFMPKPADIVRGIEGNNETKAAVAWAKVIRAIRQFGSYESVVFDDQRIHAVINDMGGWVELCRKTTKELGFIMHEFRKLYSALQYQDVKHFPSRVAGRLEKINRFQSDSGGIKPKYLGASTNGQLLDKFEISK